MTSRLNMRKLVPFCLGAVLSSAVLWHVESQEEDFFPLSSSPSARTSDLEHYKPLTRQRCSWSVCSLLCLCKRWLEWKRGDVLSSSSAESECAAELSFCVAGLVLPEINNHLFHFRVH